MISSGAYRKVPAGTPGAEWAEGVGWHVFDEQAQRETNTAARLIARRYWEEQLRCGQNLVTLAQGRLSQLKDS